MNLFADFPSRGLDSVLHLKAHNNPNLRDFPGAARFPRVRSLVLSYAYHCCSFLASILHLYRKCKCPFGFAIRQLGWKIITNEVDKLRVTT